jgi:hypothetical protein
MGSRVRVPPGSPIISITYNNSFEQHWSNNCLRVAIRVTDISLFRSCRRTVRLRSDRARRRGPPLAAARTPQGDARDGVALQHFTGDGAIIFRHACALGCEGIVPKRLGSPYRSGRVDHWLKVKNPAAPAAGNAHGHAAEWLRSGLQIRFRTSLPDLFYPRRLRFVGSS